MAVELGIPTEGVEEGFAKPFDELLEKGLLMYSQKVKTVYAPNFLKYNFPDNPNQVRGFDVALDFIPEGDLFRFVLWNTARIIHENQKDSFIKALPIPFAEQYAEGLPEGFAEPFRKGLPKLRAKNQELRTNKEITPVGPLADQPSESPQQTEEVQQQAETLFGEEEAPTPAPKKKPKRENKPKVYFPETLPDDWRERAKVIRTDVDPQVVFMKLRARYAGTSTKKTIDQWAETFFDWLGREYARTNNGYPGKARNENAFRGPSWEPGPSTDWRAGINPDFTINKKACGLV